MDLSTMSIRELIIELADTEAPVSSALRDGAIARLGTYQADRMAYQQALMIELGRRRELLGLERTTHIP